MSFTSKKKKKQMKGILGVVLLRFSDPDRSLNQKRERFKVFEVEP